MNFAAISSSVVSFLHSVTSPNEPLPRTQTSFQSARSVIKVSPSVITPTKDLLTCLSMCHCVDLGTKHQCQNANAQNPNAKNASPNPKNPNPQPSNTKVSGISYIGVLSVAFRVQTGYPLCDVMYQF